jgi:hypothetical protein
LTIKLTNYYLMEFKTKYFTFKTSPKEHKEVTKSDYTKDSLLPDEFFTYISNSILTNRLNNSRDLLLYFFNNVSEVNAIVTYIAQKCADIPVKHVKLQANGKEKDLKETDLIKKLKKPNHLNEGREYRINCFSSFFVHGFIPINIVKPVGWDTVEEMYLFPGAQFFPIPEKSTNQYGLPASGVDFRLNKIRVYRLFIDNIPFNFTPDQILMINDSNLSFINGSYLTGQSRLYSAIRSIKSLSYIYDTINTLIAGKGAEGILFKRYRPGEADGGWDPKDKKEVENKLYSYGLTDGKKPIAVTEKDLGFIRLSVPIGDFMPIELKEHEFRSLCTALMFPSMLLNDTKASTYNNIKEAEKAFYTNCVMPVVNGYYEGLTNKCGLTEIGEKLSPDYTEIECLQTDKKTQADANKVNDEVWINRYDKNLCTKNEMLLAIGLESQPDGNKYKMELEPTPIENTTENNTENEQVQTEETK